MERRGQIVIVTGPSCSGKTTYCARRVAEARAAGWDVAGVLSPARFAGAEKVGIDAVDLRSGERRALAGLRSPGTDAQVKQPSAIVTIRWTFDVEALAWGNRLFTGSTPCDLLIVDELGPLEWLHGQGWIAGIDAVETRAFATALVVVRPSLVELAQARWPDAKVLFN